MPQSPDNLAQKFLDNAAQPIKGLLRASGLAGIALGLFGVLQAYGLATLLDAVFFKALPLDQLGGPIAVFIAGLVGRFGGTHFRDRWGIVAAIRVKSALRERLMQRIAALGPAWRTEESAATMANRYLEHVDSLETYFSKYLPHRLVIGVIPLVLGALVFSQNWLSGLVVLVMFPIIPLFMVLVGKGAAKEQSKQMNALNRLGGEFLDMVRGMITIRASAAGFRFRQTLANHVEEFRSRTMQVLRLAFLSSTVLEFFTVLSIALIALLLGFGLLGFIQFGSWSTPLTLAQAFFILLVAPEFFAPLRALGAFYHAKAEATAAANRLAEFLTPENPPNPEQVNPSPRLFTAPPLLRFDQVTFGYDAAPPLLNQFSAVLAPNSVTVVRGPSGCGKTTLIRLVLGQLWPQSGAIGIDDRLLPELPITEFRDQVGWLSQWPRLIHGSLGDNLRLAKSGASDAALVAALDWAGLETWYRSLPSGLDTPMGESGQGLSGGQLRRLALARVKLREARLILLDEPAASLDQATRTAVIERIAELSQSATVLVCSHHLDTAGIADQIIELGGGANQ